MKIAIFLKKLGRISFVLIWIPGLILVFQVIAMVVWLGADGFERYVAGLSTTGNIAVFGLWIGLCLFFAIAAPLLFFGSRILAANAAGRVQKHGIDAIARILTVTDTKTRINQSIVLDLTLEVRPTGQAVFESSTSVAASIVDIGDFRPGNEIRVKYIPQTLEVAICNE